MFSCNNQFLQHSKSSGNIQQQLQLAAARRHAVQMANMAGPRILVQHPLQMQLGLRVSGPQMPLNAINSANGQNNNEVSDPSIYILIWKCKESYSILIETIILSSRPDPK